MKTFATIVLSAFSLGLVAETAIAVHSLATGSEVQLATAIELGISWLVVLAFFIANVARMVFHRGSPSILVGVAVPLHDDDDEGDDDGEGNTDGEDGETPEETPEETGETPETQDGTGEEQH